MPTGTNRRDPMMPGTLGDDHGRDFANLEQARESAAKSTRIRTIDTIIAMLDDERERSGLSKAALARAMGANPAVVRRLLSSSGMNPTLGTLAEMAAALGMKVQLAPMTDEEKSAIMGPMRAAI